MGNFNSELTGFVTSDCVVPNNHRGIALTRGYIIFDARTCTCGKSLRRHGERSVTIADLPLGAHPSELEITFPRLRCVGCGKLYTPDIPWRHAHHGMTTRLYRHIAVEALQRPFSDVTRLTGASAKVVYKIAAETVETLERGYRIEAPRRLCIDECHLAGRKRTVFTDLDSRGVIHVCEGQSRDEVASVLRKMVKADGLEAVAMDFHAPYADAVRLVFGTRVRIVIDVWHAISLVVDAMNHQRKAMQNTAKARKTNRRIRDSLRRDTILLNERSHNLHEGDKLILRGLLLNNPELQIAYDLKEQFANIFKRRDRVAAESDLLNWLESIPPHMIKMRHAAETIRIRLEDILSYFDTLATNGAAEGNNRRLKTIFRRSNGLSLRMLRAKALALPGGPWDELTITAAASGRLDELPEDLLPSTAPDDSQTLALPEAAQGGEASAVTILPGFADLAAFQHNPRKARTRDIAGQLNLFG